MLAQSDFGPIAYVSDDTLVTIAPSIADRKQITVHGSSKVRIVGTIDQLQHLHDELGRTLDRHNQLVALANNEQLAVGPPADR